MVVLKFVEVMFMSFSNVDVSKLGSVLAIVRAIWISI